MTASPEVSRSLNWGQGLTPADYESLEKSWISREIADQAMLRRVIGDEARQIVGRKGHMDCDGILIPYLWPGETGPNNYRIRRDNHEWRRDKNGVLKPDKKYLGAPGSGNRLFIPSGVTVEQLIDVAIPVVIVEGEKKALALQRLAHHGTDRPRFIPIALPGVWNWRGVTGKAGGPNGERLTLKGPIPDIERIPWLKRSVAILFDANVHTNDSVKWARRGIARELRARNAEIRLINLPEDCGVNGIDDFLALHGPDAVLNLIDKPDADMVVKSAAPPQYRMGEGGIWRLVTRNEELIEIPVANFEARITENLCLDDGVETKRDFRLRCVVGGQTHELTVPSTGFAAMEWPIEQMGSRATTFPSQKEHARAAIQLCSSEVIERRIYTHSGWRQVDGSWCYLYAGGCIGTAGAVPGIEVQLPGSLSRYELRLPPTPCALGGSIRAALKLIDLCPPSISFPLLTAVCRSVLGGADFSLHLVGETGAFKSELAALAQQFFGSGMTSRNLPASWSSTGNSLEMLLFHAKDTLVVIDDFVPPGNPSEAARYQATAERIFRAAGNSSGRGRLDSNARLREQKPPRGLILSTGEDVPRGHSIRARLLILDISKGMIDSATLTTQQHIAASGEYAMAMGGFVQWLAGCYEQGHQTFAARSSELRDTAKGETIHARTPDIIGGLQAAFELFLEFAHISDAIDEEDAERLRNQCWRALRGVAREQLKHHVTAEPAACFVGVLQSCLSSGQAHLAARNGSTPESMPDACGWRKDGGVWGARGKRVGWIEGDDLYIDPVAAFQVVQAAGRELGEILTVSLATLKKRLREKGMLASVDEKRETLTVRKTICSAKKEVLHLRRETILPAASDEASGFGDE